MEREIDDWKSTSRFGDLLVGRWAGGLKGGVVERGSGVGGWAAEVDMY
jgi:hypothetical protein